MYFQNCHPLRLSVASDFCLAFDMAARLSLSCSILYVSLSLTLAIWPYTWPLLRRSVPYGLYPLSFLFLSCSSQYAFQMWPLCTFLYPWLSPNIRELFAIILIYVKIWQPSQCPIILPIERSITLATRKLRERSLCVHLISLYIYFSLSDIEFPFIVIRQYDNSYFYYYRNTWLNVPLSFLLTHCTQL